MLLDRANEAQQVELAEAQPAEEPLVELGYADEEGKDIESLSSNEGDEADEGIYDAASE